MCRVVVLAFAVLLPSSLGAQVATSQVKGNPNAPGPRWGIFAGYSMLDPRGTYYPVQPDGSVLPVSFKVEKTGLLEAATFYFTRNVGLQVESGQHDLFTDTGGSNQGSSNSGIFTLEPGLVYRWPHKRFTPMVHALAGAAEWICAVERHAQTISGLVATVGAIHAKPGARNVIAGEARVSLDVRQRDDKTRAVAVDYLVQLAEDIATRRSLKVKSSVLLNQRAVPMDHFLVSQIEKAITSVAGEPYRMVSGAGHDAMIMAAKVPAAMIFLRTPGGISHDPAESVEVDDVAKAIDSGLQLLQQLASSSEFRRKTVHA